MGKRRKAPQGGRNPASGLATQAFARAPLNLWTILLAAVAVALPLALAAVWPRLPALGSPPALLAGQGSSFPPSTLPLKASSLGFPPRDRPLITNVNIVDLDGDGRQDVL